MASPRAARFGGRTGLGIAAGVTAVLALSLEGCYAKSTGYHGKFTFGYASGLDVENFVKPIAPGAKLDVVAFSNGGDDDDKLTITKMASSAPAVLDVSAKGDHALTITAKEPGVAYVDVTARDAEGHELSDRMFFHVAKPVRHALHHSCTEEKEATYVVGDTIDVFHDLKTADGRMVIGYDYHPFDVGGGGAIELVLQPAVGGYYGFAAKRPVTKATITSKVDASSVTVDVVDKGVPTIATLSSDDGVILEGNRTYVSAIVTLPGKVLCSQNALTRARSLTPEICSVTAKLDDHGDDNRHQLAAVTAKRFGVCKYELTLPELDGGRGVRLEGKIQVARLELPREGSLLARHRPEIDTLGRRALNASLQIQAAWMFPRLVIAAIALAQHRRQRRDRMRAERASD